MVVLKTEKRISNPGKASGDISFVRHPLAMMYRPARKPKIKWPINVVKGSGEELPFLNQEEEEEKGDIHHTITTRTKKIAPQTPLTTTCHTYST